jgi:hypothetical protein
MVQYITAAFHHSKAKMTARFVLVCLANHADAAGYCYPSAGRIAKHCGMTIRGVRKALSDLIDIGEIKVVKKGGTIDGQKISNVYQILLPVEYRCTTCTGEPYSPVLTSESRAPVNDIPKTGEPYSPVPVNDVHPKRHKETSIETSVNTPLTPQRGEGGQVSKAKPTRPAAKPKLITEDSVAEFQSNPAYELINVRTEYFKALTWHEEHNRLLTRRSFVNWLNRAQPTRKPINGQAHKPQPSINPDDYPEAMDEETRQAALDLFGKLNAIKNQPTR